VARLIDADGNLTMLVRSGATTYARPIAPALGLNPILRRGPAAEDASLAAASIWGLPDFVMRPKEVAKGNGRREVGDGTLITGDRGVAVQVKSRESPSTNPEREANWIQKKSSEGARQAAGTIRTLTNSHVDLVNARGRLVRCDGSKIEWVRVVILDHPNLPEITMRYPDKAGIPVVALARIDWDFLFEQLRSTSAVVNYLHRIARLEPITLGTETSRYYELARADETAPPDSGPVWMEAMDAERLSHPLLPSAPVTSVDSAGHTVFRMMLEDIAQSPFDRDENDRLIVLALLDRFSVGARAELGRLLISHLDSVMSSPTGTTVWRHRRVVQDGGTLQLAFGACSQLTPVHREAFAQWSMLRHHEFTTFAIDVDEPRTVAVLLTPRWDGQRPWDTTLFALHGKLEFDPDELAAMEAFWNRESSSP
jgi:hypothetical protein